MLGRIGRSLPTHVAVGNLDGLIFYRLSDISSTFFFCHNAILSAYFTTVLHVPNALIFTFYFIYYTL